MEALDLSLLSLQKCDTSPGHQAMRGIEAAFAFLFFSLSFFFFLVEGGFASVIFTGVYRGITMLWVRVFSFLTGSN